MDAAGQMAQQMGGVGAVANRNAANQLFQQALQHEKQGYAQLSPGLLSQAAVEAQQGVKADDQSRHLAQTAMQAIQNSHAAGNLDLSKYGVTESQVRDLANSSSPYLPQVQSDLASWGIGVNHDHSIIQSPFGPVPIDASATDMANVMGGIAKTLGFNSDSISQGVNNALASAAAINKSALAEAQAAAAGGGGRGGSNPAGGTPAQPSAQREIASEKSMAANADASKTFGKIPLEAHDEDLSARLLALDKQRESMSLKLGLNSAGTNVADQRQNLFQVVHNRYRELENRGQFLKVE